MRACIIVILLLAMSPSEGIACAPFYPRGEVLRFQLLEPDHLGYEGYAPFYYSARGVPRMYAGHQEALTGMGRAKNVQLWQERTDGSLGRRAIRDAIYKEQEEVRADDPFMEYLKKKDPEAREYLAFAKKCSQYNRFNSYDPWEKDHSVQKQVKKEESIGEALERARSTDDGRLTLRYRFLALRLAYYCKDLERVRRLHERFFEGREEQHIIDHWARYFKTKAMEDGPERNHHAAQVFDRAPDKRFKVHYCYERSIPVGKTLELADNDRERAAVWALHGIVHPGPALESIEKLHDLRPGSKVLSYLLLRELNKLEDWVLTPYYSQFQPALCVHNDRSEYETAAQIQKRVASDRAYASELLEFIDSVDIPETSDPLLWRTAQGYLRLMVREPEDALQDLNTVLEREDGERRLARRVERIKAVCSIARQPEGDAELPDEIAPVLMRDEEHSDLIFAIARELEYKGNHTAGTIMLSKLNEVDQGWDGGHHWRTKERHQTLRADFYKDYFYYLDATYSPDQLRALMVAVKKGKERDDAFSQWKFSVLEKDLSRLHELMGTKWIRRDELRKARTSFSRVDDSLWQSDAYPFQNYFDKDPFAWEWYNTDISIAPDSLNKELMTEQLLEYRERAKDPDAADRDLAYFRLANGYNNMTYYGNAWMMRRYYWTGRRTRSGLLDDAEYARGKKAQHYYERAAELSDNQRFTALCLALAGICRDRGLSKELREEYDDLSYTELLEKQEARNPYYQRIKTDHPDGTYEDLMNKCLFSRYQEDRVR